MIDAKDVRLATQMMLDKAFTTPPTRDVLFEVARAKNSTPLPLVKINCGLRLPPDRYCLSACNYKLRAAAQAKKVGKSTIEARSVIKTSFKSPAGITITNQPVKKPTAVPVPKTQTVSIPKPIFKFSTTPNVVKQGASSNLLKPKEETKMEVDDFDSGKRKREEEDDFEVVE